MKTQILLVLCLMSSVQLAAQFFDEQIGIDAKGNINVGVNSQNISVKLDPSASNEEFVLGGYDALKQYKTAGSGFQLIKIDTAQIGGGVIERIFHCEIDQLTIGDVLLTKYPVLFKYQVSSKAGQKKLVANAKPSIGLGFLRMFSNSSVSNGQLLLEDMPCKISSDPAACGWTGGTNSINPPTGAGSIFTTSDPITIRIVPCSLSSKVTQVKNQLLNGLNQVTITLEEETDVPPIQAAVDRVDQGFTIRYFDNADSQLADELESRLAQLFPGDDLDKEDMTPYYNQGMPRYLEVWIK